MDVSTFLHDLGLARYEQLFLDNDVDADVLSKLTAEDLIAIGITSVGHRRKLLEAIAAIKVEPCGPAEAEPSAIDRVSELPPARREAERRQLTVMFCDLVGSTALSAKLDPEDMRTVIAAYQNACSDAIRRYEGHVAKFMGDGVLAYFGWPQAHEDDAERAVRAGLELTETIRRQTIEGTRLAGRIGIATGQVVVGDLVGEGAAQEEAVTGETPNLAARLQALAEPGAVVIAAGTQKLVGGLFELNDLGEHRLKGFAPPVQAWRVVGEGRAESRFAALHGARLTPLVGRDEELALLLARWRRARDGDGQVVLLAGGPGIGKSRITQALLQRLGDEPYTRLRYYCSPYHTNSALHPVIDQLERTAGFQTDDDGNAKLDKLEALLGLASDRVGEVAPLLATLCSVAIGERYPPLNLAPQAQKARTLEALIGQLEGLAKHQPVLMILEDAHWIDPTTTELFELVIDRIQRLPVLLLITFRPEFVPPWAGHAHTTTLTLNRLGRNQGAAIIQQLTGGRALPAEVLDQILAKTDGVPLFVEELTKTVLESGLLEEQRTCYVLTGPLTSPAIPSTLHDSLMARLDRLAPVKEVAQVGAVIGRKFPHDLLAAVTPMPANLLGDALDQLVTSELIFRRGVAPDATYTFKHALVQDAAYQSLLKSKRQQLHARIATALEYHFPAVAAAQPEVLARHLTEAGQTERAVPYWREAGQRAAERSAFKEAAADIDQGLALLASLPASAERRRLEIGLRLVLGLVLTATKGPAVPEAGQTYARARECCHESGDHAELFAATWNLWHFHAHGSGSHLEDARRLADELLTIAQQRSDPALLLQAHHAIWTTCSRVPGMLAACRDHAEQGFDLYDREQHRTHRFIYGGHDPGVCCRYMGAWAWWLLGYPDHAIARATEGANLADELAHPLSAILAQSYLCWLRYWRREQDLTGARAAAAMALCAEHGIAPHYLAAGRILQGWVLAAQGEANEGLAEAQKGLVAFRSAATTRNSAFMFAVFAEVCGCAGQLDQGLEAVADALDVIEETGERVWEAEIYRRKGMLLAAQGAEHWTKAEASYGQALEAARAQGVKSLELRAATSLARLWDDQGKRTQARDLLAPVYGWFTEGFDTADLKDAKALLDELR